LFRHIRVFLSLTHTLSLSLSLSLSRSLSRSLPPNSPISLLSLSLSYLFQPVYLAGRSRWFKVGVGACSEFPAILQELGTNTAATTTSIDATTLASLQVVVE
jgi:hypothetical protein